MLDLLEGLGLTAYEAKVLSHLLRHGPRTGPDLSRETGVPFGRVYDTLKGLEERGLVTVEAGRPKRFAAVAPKAVPQRLLAASRRRLQEEAQVMERHVAELETEVARFVPHDAPSSTAYGVRLGEDAGRELLIEATHEARDRVATYLALEQIRDEDLALFDACEAAVQRGVRIRILLREADVDYLVSTPYVARVLEAVAPHLGETLQVRVSREDATPFSVLDGHRVLLGVHNPLDTRSYFAVVHVDDTDFAGRLEHRFEALWDAAALDKGLMQRVLRRLESEGPDGRAGRLLEAWAKRRARRFETG